VVEPPSRAWFKQGGQFPGAEGSAIFGFLCFSGTKTGMNSSSSIAANLSNDARKNLAISALSKAEPVRIQLNGVFSIRPGGVKRFQTISISYV
jgi:hypothetical protein